MVQSDWYREVEIAADWWTEQFQAAAKMAYPEASLFGAIGRNTVTPERLAKFRSEVIANIDRKLWSNERPTEAASWDRDLPLKDAMRRRFGKETSILSDEIKKAAEASGLGEVVASIPVGCVSVVNPGRIFVSESRKQKDQIIIVQYRPPAGSVESTDDGN